ncbi:hypothetical protein BaRGS_00036317, partial [Batillaria attramentaria]
LALSRLLLTKASPAPRAFSTTPRALSQGWQQYGVVGSNLPFSIKNRYKVTLIFILFFGSGFNLPFIVVAHQLMKH